MYILFLNCKKNIDLHLLSKGTTFKAGKDENNNDLFYSLTDDLVVKQASVKALKSLFLDKESSPVVLYASPDADSDDGQGAKLTSTDSSWLPFGDPKKIAKANIGLAIASNILYLNEGSRAVSISFQCDDLTQISESDLSEIFTIQFTGKKNWWTAENYTSSITGNAFALAVTIPGDAPAIIPYSQKIHGGNFTQALPMVQLLLKDYKSYQKIKSLRISSIKLKVSATVKDLSLQSNDGKINPAKPFKPFGEFPEDGSAFIIGSKEIFQKPLTKLVIDIDWQQTPLYDTTVDLAALSQQNWITFSNNVTLSASTITIQKSTGSFFQQQANFGVQQTGGSGNFQQFFQFNDPSFQFNDPFFQVIDPFFDPNIFLSQPVTVSGLNDIPQSQADFTANVDYSVTSIDGFVKLELNGNDYSLSEYLSQLPAPSVTVNYDTTDTSKITGFTSTTPAVSPPSPPVAKSISLSYTAEESILFNETIDEDFDQRTHFYYHVEPFGFREMHPFITTDALNFLPVFNLDDGIATDNGGELWIGLNNAQGGETFSILFQVSDGSANPLKNMTEVNWYYLSENNWLPFDDLSVSDQTNNLTPGLSPPSHDPAMFHCISAH